MCTKFSERSSLLNEYRSQTILCVKCLECNWSKYTLHNNHDRRQVVRMS